MLRTKLKLLTLKSQESLSSEYQVSCVQAHSCHSPDSRGPRLQGQPGAIPCLPLPGSPLPWQTDGLAKLWRELVRGSRGFQRELEESQGEFPLQQHHPCHRASQAQLITMVSKGLLVPESEHPPKLLPSCNTSFITCSPLFISFIPHPHIRFCLLLPK